MTALDHSSTGSEALADVSAGRATAAAALPAEAQAEVERLREDLLATAQRLDAARAELAAERERRQALEGRIRYLSHLVETDPLSGLASRRHFLQAAAAELARSRRYGTPLALMMLDIDRFKDLNDRFGHAAGDAAIAALGAACRQSCRTDIDLAGRLGGEEFAVLMPHTAAAGALDLAERLCRTLAGLPISHEGRELRITVSIGVAERLSSDAAIGDLLKRADQALYAAKRGGRNRAVRIAA